MPLDLLERAVQGQAQREFPVGHPVRLELGLRQAQPRRFRVGRLVEHGGGCPRRVLGVGHHAEALGEEEFPGGGDARPRLVRGEPAELPRDGHRGRQLQQLAQLVGRRLRGRLHQGIDQRVLAVDPQLPALRLDLGLGQAPVQPRAPRGGRGGAGTVDQLAQDAGGLVGPEDPDRRQVLDQPAAGVDVLPQPHAGVLDAAADPGRPAVRLQQGLEAFEPGRARRCPTGRA